MPVARAGRRVASAQLQAGLVRVMQRCAHLAQAESADLAAAVAGARAPQAPPAGPLQPRPPAPVVRRAGRGRGPAAPPAVPCPPGRARRRARGRSRRRPCARGWRSAHRCRPLQGAALAESRLRAAVHPPRSPSPGWRAGGCCMHWACCPGPLLLHAVPGPAAPPVPRGPAPLPPGCPRAAVAASARVPGRVPSRRRAPGGSAGRQRRGR